MTVPAGTFQTFQAVGNREDLSDYIYDISPTETPFVTSCRKGKATAVFTEWQTDALDSATALNTTIEGDDATTNSATPTVRPRNYVQLMDKVPRVTSTQNAVNSAGRKSELSYQIAKRGKELKRDVESALCSNNGSSAGTAAAARALGGLESWYTSNVSRGTGGASGGYTAGGTTTAAGDTTQRTFTEAMLKAVIKSCWDNGGDPKMVMVGSFNKQTVSGFSGIATLYRDTAPKLAPASIMGAADIYVSDFGQHAIVPNRFSRARSAHVLDMDYWEVAVLQPMKIENLAKTGHSERRLLSTELTLCSKNQAASGVVADLTTS